MVEGFRSKKNSIPKKQLGGSIFPKVFRRYFLGCPRYGSQPKPSVVTCAAVKGNSWRPVHNFLLQQFISMVHVLFAVHLRTKSIGLSIKTLGLLAYTVIVEPNLARRTMASEALGRNVRSDRCKGVLGGWAPSGCKCLVTRCQKLPSLKDLPFPKPSF